MEQQARRGFVPSDERDFGENSLEKLRKAAEEVYFMKNLSTSEGNDKNM